MKKRHLFEFLSILIVVCCVGTYITYKQYQNERLEKDRLILAQVSAKIGIKPDWLALRKYIFCDFFKVGMTRNEVEKGLSKIGQIETTPDGEEIWFKNEVINYHIGKIGVRYSSIFEDKKIMGWNYYLEANFVPEHAECEAHIWGTITATQAP